MSTLTLHRKEPQSRSLIFALFEGAIRTKFFKILICKYKKMDARLLEPHQRLLFFSYNIIQEMLIFDLEYVKAKSSLN